MTNKEFYGDKLLAVTLKANCHILYRMVHRKGCTGLFCEDCEFDETKESEIEKILQWLNAEHKEPEPPLLENGDGLKPGDWIMVRQDFGEEWLRVKFAFFNNYFFYAISENASFDRDTMCLYRWQQARLPEEGE